MRIGYGDFEHPAGTLTIKRGPDYDTVSLRLSTPHGNARTLEWFWSDKGFDGTGTELAVGVPVDDFPEEGGSR